MHNYYVLRWIDAFNCEALDYNEAVNAYRMIGLEDFYEEDIQSLTREIWAFDSRAGQNNISSVITFELYNELIKSIEAFESIPQLFVQLNEIRMVANSNLDCFDWNFIMTCISVAEKSAILWTPEQLGGLGTGLNCGLIQSRISWWKRAIVSDVSGAAGYFAAVGVGLIIPGANAAIAGGIAFAAGYTSAMSLFWP